MDYPRPEEVRTATHIQLARWHRFLPLPSNQDQLKTINDIRDTLHKKYGGITSTISKLIGWKE